jgi:hypothetical protein
MKPCNRAAWTNGIIDGSKKKGIPFLHRKRCMTCLCSCCSRHRKCLTFLELGSRSHNTQSELTIACQSDTARMHTFSKNTTRCIASWPVSLLSVQRQCSIQVHLPTSNPQLQLASKHAELDGKPGTGLGFLLPQLNRQKVALMDIMKTAQGCALFGSILTSGQCLSSIGTLYSLIC